MAKLPYEFDLYYDIKTKESLDNELEWAIQKVDTLVHLMKVHKIEMSSKAISLLKELNDNV